TEVLDGKTPAWTAGVTATLTRFPLGDVPFFVDRDVGGNVSGHISIDHLHDHPSVKADLDIPDLHVGELMFTTAKVAVDVSKPLERGANGIYRTAGSANLDLATTDGGRLNVSAAAGVVWNDDGVAPAACTEHPGEFALRASRFRLATLQPVVAGMLSKLDGYL